jgi:hypothetical protein
MEFVLLFNPYTINIMITLVTNPLIHSTIKECEIEHYIVISSDSLLIINKHLELVENIIRNNDNSGLILSCSTEDDFLDSISFFKNMILSGGNPCHYVTEVLKLQIT